MKLLKKGSNLINTKNCNKNEKFILNYSIRQKLLFYMIVLLPIIDSLNGYFLRNFDISGIGSKYHLLIIIVLVLFMINKNGILFGKYERMTFYLFISFLLSFMLNSFFGTKITNIGIERTNKILSTAIILTSLYRLQKENIIQKNFLYNMLNLQSYIVSILVLVCNLTGIYNYSYKVTQQGRIGLYNNLNELVLIFCIFLFHNIKIISEKYTNKRAIIIIIIMIDLMFTESKFAIGMIVVSVLLIIYKFFNLRKLKIRLSSLIITIMLPIGIYVITKNLQSVLLRMSSRQEYLYNTYGSNNLMNYLSSGRTTRFNNLIIEPISKLLNSSNIIENLHGIVMFLFGNGLSSSYYQTFEMDIFDVFLLSGLLGTIIFLNFNIKILKDSIRNQKKLIDCFGLFIILLGSSVVGHVWTGGVCGIYFAMLAVDFMKQNDCEGEF